MYRRALRKTRGVRRTEIERCMYKEASRRPESGAYLAVEEGDGGPAGDGPLGGFGDRPRHTLDDRQLAEARHDVHVLHTGVELGGQALQELGHAGEEDCIGDHGFEGVALVLGLGVLVGHEFVEEALAGGPAFHPRARVPHEEADALDVLGIGGRGEEEGG
jgi:hypothetical protein